VKYSGKKAVRQSAFVPHYVVRTETKREFLKNNNQLDNKEFSVLYLQSPSSTVGIQLHVSALYVGYLQVVL